MSLGIMVSINQRLDAEVIELVASEFGYEVEFINLEQEAEQEAEIIDDVEIYFDNKIGIVAPQDYKVKEIKPKVLGEPNGEYGENKFKYNILKVIEKRNQEEEAIAELITDFESKIDAFFEFIKTDEMGKRLIAKIKDAGSAFTQDEIYTDFNKLYRKYTIMNKDLGEFFKRETKDILNQLCDDFERSLV